MLLYALFQELVAVVNVCRVNEGLKLWVRVIRASDSTADTDVDALIGVIQ